MHAQACLSRNRSRALTCQNVLFCPQARPCAPRAPGSGTAGNTRHLYHKHFCSLLMSLVEVWSQFPLPSLPPSQLWNRIPPNSAPLHPDTPTQGASNAVDGPRPVAFLACLSRRRAPHTPQPQTPPPCFLLLHFCPPLPPSSSLGRDGLVLFRPQQHGAGSAPFFCPCHYQ